MSAFTKRKAVAFAAVAAIPFSLAVSTPAFAATTVNDWDTLKAEFDGVAAGTSETIVLGGDITAGLNETLVVEDNGGAGGASVTLDLAGHDLDIPASAQNYAAGIQVTEGAALVVTDSVGGGTLTVAGGYGAAGIGSTYGSDSGPDGEGYRLGDVTIAGGAIDATGGEYAAAIGGTYYETGGFVRITGGAVTAMGGYNGAGIGTGYYSGYYNSDDLSIEIEITGGVVDATGGQYAAGIGAGYGAKAAKVTIEDAVVTAEGNEGGAGIGGAYYTPNSAPITIARSTVAAVGSTYDDDDGADADLYGGAGIGEGAGQTESDDMTVLITDSDVTATGGTHAAGIGTGSDDTDNEDQDAVRSLQGVAILNSKVTATGGGGAAGIGGAQGQPGTLVEIGHGSHVVATGGSSEATGGGAGIGAGASFSDMPAPDAGTLLLEGAARLGAAETAGDGAGVDRVEALDSIGGEAATLTGDDSDYTWNAVSVDGVEPGDGGATDVTWDAAITPADTPTPALAETGSGDVAPGLAIGGLLMAVGAVLFLRRRVRAKA